jgi:hypothetical protein
MVLEVTGGGIQKIERELTMDEGGASGQVSVPVNKSLTYTVTAYRDETEVLGGSTEYTAKKGGGNDIQIVLDYLIPALILTPSRATLAVNGTLNVYLEARGVTDLATLGARITFDPGVLQVTDLGREDDFLIKGGGSVLPAPGGFTKDNSLGRVTIILSIFPATKAVSGNGRVGRIEFKAIGFGTTPLDLSVDNAIDNSLGLFDKKADLMDSLGLGSELTIE